MFIATIILLALSRAEILERFKAPVITQADGLVQVYANCPEDMRREFQMPIAGFAAETVKTLYQGLRRKPERFRQPGIVIHIGDVRTNLTEVVMRVATNDSRIVTRIYVKSPGFADLYQLKLAVVKGFFRSVEGRELTEGEAVTAYRRGDPALRIVDERQRLEDWLQGRGEIKDDEEGLKLMRKIIEPGKASRRDVLTFASRLFLYPPVYGLRFQGKYDYLSFRDAVKFAKIDPSVRMIAALKAEVLPAFGSGRGDEMTAAVYAYEAFLLALAQNEKSEQELKQILYEADEKLNIAYERAVK